MLIQVICTFSPDNSKCLTQTLKVVSMDCFTFTFVTKNMMVHFNEWYLETFFLWKRKCCIDKAINRWNTFFVIDLFFSWNCKLMLKYTLKIKQLVSQYFSHATHSNYNPFSKTTANKTQQQCLVTLKKIFFT